MKEAILADTGAATVTIKFFAVANFVSAFTAFDGSIDELKHQTFRFSELERLSAIKKIYYATDTCRLAWFR
ncbi:MAG TPA: hypothetical protein VEG60_19315 [Candidatus Binatia bacterium]|nr:hypothetical protein [Candidatus Binatia bacterium]